MTRAKNSRKPNGHAGANGHAAVPGDSGGVQGCASTSHERGGVAVPGTHGNLAASDDVRGAFVAAAATSAAACTNHATYADAAPSPPPGKDGRSDEISADLVDLYRPTNLEALQDSAAFVNAVAARIDLVSASVRLVKSDDEKIAKAELDRLREMKFGKAGASAAVVDEPVTVDLTGMPRPIR